MGTAVPHINRTSTQNTKYIIISHKDLPFKSICSFAP